MEPKKVILLASSDINYDQRIQKVANSLVSFNFDVKVVGRQLHKLSSPQIHSFNLESVACTMNNGILFYLELNLRFFIQLIRESFDILCANDVDTLPAALFLKMFKKFDLVYDAHEYFTEVPELQDKHFKKWIWSTIEKWGVRRASKCYTVNESLAEIFKQKFDKEFQVIRNLPLSLPGEELSAKKDFILYQGALNEGRGLEILIKAMQQVEGELLLAGRGDIEEDLKALVQDLELSDRVKFLGMLLPVELKRLTQEAKIGVNLLESRSLNYYYSLANKFFDYMHAGVPSINMNFPEYAAINAKSKVAVLIDELNEELISKAVNQLLINQDEYEVMSANCKDLSEKYTWQKEEQTLAAIYSFNPQ